MSKAILRAIVLKVPPIRRLWDHANALAQSRELIARELAEARLEIDQLRLAQDERATQVWRLEHQARVRSAPEESLRMYVMRSDLQRAQAAISRQRAEINDLRAQALALAEAKRGSECKYALLSAQISHKQGGAALSAPERLLAVSFALDDLRGRITDPDIRTDAYQGVIERLAILAHDLGQISVSEDGADVDVDMVVALQARYLDVLERLLSLRQATPDRVDVIELTRLRAVLDRALREEGGGDYLQVGGAASTAILARGAFISAGFKPQGVWFADTVAHDETLGDRTAQTKVAFHRFGLLDDGVHVVGEGEWIVAAKRASVLNLASEGDDALANLAACYDVLPVGCYIIGPYAGPGSAIDVFLSDKGFEGSAVELGGKRGLWRRPADWTAAPPKTQRFRTKAAQ